MKNLNFKTNMDLTDAQKTLVIGSVFLGLFILLGWLIVVQPVLIQAQKLQRTQRLAHERHQFASEILKLQDEKQKFSQVLGAAEDRHLILAKVTELAQQMKIDINTITPSLEQGQQFPELVLELSGKASFSSLMNFLNALERTDPGVFVRKLEIRISRGYRRNKTDESMPEVSMILVTYLKPSKTINFQPNLTTGI